jgi:hypothetical protein
MSLCYKTSDNKYKECAPRMADGRHFTDYRPNCEVNTFIRSDNNIKNSFDYRTFLQTNAETLMNKNRDISTKKNYCKPCDQENFESTMLPEKYMQSCDQNNCEVKEVNKEGLGLGRDYGSNFESIDCKKSENNECEPLYEKFKFYGDKIEGYNL